MKGAVITWINGRGNTQTRSFEVLDKGVEFAGVLDERITRGTCGGYTMTECETDPTVCPVCGNRHLEEHGTEPGDWHWWMCTKCGWLDDGVQMVYNDGEEVSA